MTERADTMWLRSIARRSWDDNVSNALFLAASELETLRAATAWRPISTAPRDGTRALLSVPGLDDCIIVGFWNRGSWRVCWDQEPFEDEQVVAWQPLPTPPDPAA